ncbi:hypothetical protein ACFX19_023143 [Malus domestica]
MIVDVDHFFTVMVSMVDAHLPKNKRKGKTEFIPTQYVPKQNSQPRLKVDLSSNEPSRYFLNLAYAESMSDSSTEEIDRRLVLCSRCKSNVIITKPKEQPLWVEAPQLASATVATFEKVLNAGQC